MLNTLHLVNNWYKWTYVLVNFISNNENDADKPLPAGSIFFFFFFKFEWPSLRVMFNTWWSVCAQCVRLRWELIVRFVNIGGIDDHHCLNCLFIINKRASDYSQIYGFWLPLWYLQTLPNKSRNLKMYEKQMLFKLNCFR
jgi:hypothetical protein